MLSEKAKGLHARRTAYLSTGNGQQHPQRDCNQARVRTRPMKQPSAADTRKERKKPVDQRVFGHLKAAGTRSPVQTLTKSIVICNKTRVDQNSFVFYKSFDSFNEMIVKFVFIASRCLYNLYKFFQIHYV